MGQRDGGMDAVQVQYFPLSGGLDQVSPALSLLPGMVRDALNYECSISGGYTRIVGYERFDGRPSPSAQAYWTLPVTITGTLVVGNTVVGATSGAFGVVCAVDSTTTPGATVLAVTKLTGTFAASEPLKVGGVVVATTSGAESRSGAATPLADVTYTAAAANIYRADVQQVPGSGQVLGVWMFNDVVYAFRNNAGGTAALMYRATAAGWVVVTTPTLLPGGKYQFVNGNFGGTVALNKMFGCDSVNKAFQFDGTTFTQISTGMAVDTPNLIEFHKNYLWLAFGASLQHSALGDPLTWSVIVGAGELALGETMTSLKSYIGNNSYIGTESSNAMLVHTTSKTYVMYGSSNVDWSLAKHSDTAGAVPGSVQIADQPYYLSDFGVVNLTVTQAYGNFVMSALSTKIQPFITQERPRETTSCIVRAKSQYRLFFNDGYVLYTTFLNGKVLGMMICNLGLPIFSVMSLKRSDNTEAIFASSNTGYVYQLDAGTSFDGTPILAYLDLAFAYFKSPRVLKRFRKAVLEVKGNGYFEYSVSADLAWADPLIQATPSYTGSAALSSTPWDTFVWDQFFWDGVSNGPAEIPLDGTGENIGIKIVSQSDAFESYTMASAMIHYSLRRQLR